MPASCITRWWTNLPALQFTRDQYDALHDVLFKLKSRKIKYLPNRNEQKLISVICKVFEPLKTLGEHMGAEKVVTASAIWPVYSKIEETLLHINQSKYTCRLTQEESQSTCHRDKFGDSEQLFPTQSQSTICTLVDEEISSYFNAEENHEDNSDDEFDTVGPVDNVNTIDMLDHIENHIKQAIKTTFQKRYINNEINKIFLQKISFLDPRYRLLYIHPTDIVTVMNSIKFEMDEIGNQNKDNDYKSGIHGLYKLFKNYI